MNRLLILLMLVCTAACRETPTSQHHDSVELQLAVTPTGSPDNPITISTAVFNAGSTALMRYNGCSFWIGGTSLHIESMDGTRSYHLFMDALCPDSMVRFEPGERLEGTTRFMNNIFVGGGIDAPSGEYKVFLRFHAWPSGSDPSEHVFENTATFSWDSGS